MGENSLSPEKRTRISDETGWVAICPQLILIELSKCR